MASMFEEAHKPTLVLGLSINTFMLIIGIILVIWWVSRKKESEGLR